MDKKCSCNIVGGPWQRGHWILGLHPGCSTERLGEAALEHGSSNDYMTV
jgi:hypothetical protein